MKFRLVREYAVNQDIFISPSIYSGLSSSIGCTVTAQFISLDPVESLGKVTAAAIKASVEANGGSARTQASAGPQQDPLASRVTKRKRCFQYESRAASRDCHGHVRGDRGATECLAGV